MLAGLEPVLDPTNIKETNSLEVVNAEFKKFTESYRNNEDPAIEPILQATGLAFFKNQPPADEEEEMLRQEIMKSKGGKRGTTIQMMDESEAAEQTARKHK